MPLRFAVLLAFLAFPAGILAMPSASGRNIQTTQSANPFALAPTSEEIEAAQMTAAILSRFHYHPVALDEKFSAAVFDRLIKTIDPSRSYFTSSDLAQWANLRTTLVAGLQRGEVTPAFAPIDRYLERASENIRFAQGLLSAGFDFDGHESVDIERKAAPWPTSDDDLRDLWRKRAKDDWLRLKLAGQSDKAIRETLGHRYAAMLRRLQKTTASDAFELLMTACAESADPHTDYFVPRAASQFNSDMSLSLEGIGAYLGEHNDYIQVADLVAGGPASKSGKLHVGDRIVGVGQGDSGTFQDVIGWRVSDVVELVRGKAGSTVRLQVSPDGAIGDGSPVRLTLVRRKISLDDQAASSTVTEAVDNGVVREVGIITIPSFYEDFDAHRAGDPKYRSLTRDVAGMLSEFSNKHVDGVLLDLRNDGGGSLSEATALAGLFMGAGPVVQVRNAKGETETQSSPLAPAIWNGPVGVLVNHGSASASEIFAAALQDRGRGIIIGERTFGKGTVQNLVNLSTFSTNPQDALGELKMTIAEFFRVNGASTQLLGVTPDVAFPDQGNEADFGESSYDNALPNSKVPALDVSKSSWTGSHRHALVQLHEARVAHSPRWALMLDELKAVQHSRAVGPQSLNYADRKAERDADVSKANSFRARRRSIDATEGLTDAEDTSAVKEDDGLMASERKLAPRAKVKADPSSDPQLQEAAQVVADEALGGQLLVHRGDS
jgi:carboxyl-terminal processing protease